MSRATCRGQRSHVVSLAGQCGNSAVFRRLRGSTRLLVPQILPIWRFMMMCRDGAAVGRHVGLIPVVPYDFASHVDDLTGSGHKTLFLLLVASYLDIPARMALRRLKHRRMAGGNGLDMLRAEDQPHSPFARHSPQRALLTGWSLLITCSVLHEIRDGRHGLCVDMRLVRPVCSCSHVATTMAAVANSHFLRLRLQFQHPVLVRTCLALGLRRAVCAGRGSWARRLPARGEAEAPSPVVIVSCGTCPPGCSL